MIIILCVIYYLQKKENEIYTTVFNQGCSKCYKQKNAQDSV